MASGAPVKTVVSITCYADPDYVRSRTLRTALSADPAVRLIIVKNTARGVARYWQVLRDLWRVTRREKPDVFLLNFRGYELLLPMLLLAGGKPVVFDEFINPMLVVREHRMRKRGVIRMLMGAWGGFGWLYHALIKRCALILTDTTAHAAYSAGLSGLPQSSYVAIPVGADEMVFSPAVKPKSEADRFQVFFYSTGSQPLHGMPVIMDAAALLADRPDIEFLIAGTKGGIADQIRAARGRGAHIVHRAWIPFEELPETIRQSGVCLGGPFGGTQQAQLVVTGKTYQFLACQSPVIVGEAPSMSDFVDRQNSLVVPQDDAVALAAAIRWAADHRPELQDIAAAGRKMYEQKYSANVINAQVAAIFSRF